MSIDADFWRNKRVLLTGHTGFKGAWMALWLEQMGAQVFGLGLAPDSDPSLHQLLQPADGVVSTIGDIRDAKTVEDVIGQADPEIVIHMAAQALVRRSYREPVETLSSNVMGTVNVMEGLRKAKNLDVALCITSDKVYQNTDDGIAFAEDAPLGGDDPYSASKACQELVAQSWAKSFFADRATIIATARAGNVIGGGDFSEDRLIPDIYRSLASGEKLTLRSPDATRPWQHVLDLNAGYLIYIQHLSQNRTAAPLALNFGPPVGDTYTVGAVTEKMMGAFGMDATPDVKPSKLKEKTLLSVDAGLAREVLGWSEKLNVDETVRWTADWYGAYLSGTDPKDVTRAQLHDYMSLHGLV